MSPISVKSWHYRLVFYVLGKWYFQKYKKIENGFGVEIVPKNITLCKYFWSIVLCCAIFHGKVLSDKVIVPIFEFLDDVYNKRPIKIKWPKFNVNPVYVRVIMGFVLIGVGISHYLDENYGMMGFQFGLGIFLICGLGIIKYLIENKHKRQMLKMIRCEKPKEKHHSLTLEYLKARKGKYCPILQFYEPVDNKELI